MRSWRPKHLILPGDVGRTEPFVLLQIEEPKTRFKAARHQVARVDQPQLVSLIESVFGTYHPERFLWGASPQTLRLRFQRILGALKIASLPDGLSRGLDLGSLRAGGASWLLLTSEDSELVRRRGRWISHKIMEVYVQEAAAIQFLPRLDKSTREGILAGANHFPRVVEKLHTFSKAKIPETAWKFLLVSGDARFAEDGKVRDHAACANLANQPVNYPTCFWRKRCAGWDVDINIDTCKPWAQSLPSLHRPIPLSPEPNGIMLLVPTWPISLWTILRVFGGKGALVEMLYIYCTVCGDQCLPHCTTLFTAKVSSIQWKKDHSKYSNIPWTPIIAIQGRSL